MSQITSKEIIGTVIGLSAIVGILYTVFYYMPGGIQHQQFCEKWSNTLDTNRQTLPYLVPEIHDPMVDQYNIELKAYDKACAIIPQ